ncbi:hypothetical protein BKA62DRAFT_729230 [Auriculariales sp. MPI-PUGE-AT-0066]|nr:hypothetical protein BKA62DRAFT_729230 [Auriculariales sp. MPI-PUGE-AT-0066]
MSIPPTVFTPAARLPPEVFGTALWFLSVNDIITASHVSSAWRTAAFDHPVYWRTLMLSSASPGSLARFSHRLTRGGLRPIALYVKLLERDDQRIEKGAIPILKAAIPRARELHIGIESWYRGHLEHALAQAVPELRVFDLFYNAPGTPDIFINMGLGKYDNILVGAGSPSVLPLQLRKVTLNNIILPPNVLEAFAPTEEVEFIHTTETLLPEFPCYLFEFFPRMKRLSIAAGAVYFPKDHITSEFRNRFSQLDFLQLRFHNDYVRQCLDNLPVERIPDVRIVHASEDVIYDAFSGMESPFDIEFLEDKLDGDAFEIVVRCGKSGRTRRFFEGKEFYFTDSGRQSELLFNDFDKQMGHLLIQTSIWALVTPHLARYPTCEMLVVDIDEEVQGTVRLPQERLDLPALRTLVFQSSSIHGFSRLDAEDVVGFANRLGDMNLHLELRGTLMNVCGAEVLGDRFVGVDSIHPWA